MPNKKISALTGATTPLTGAEIIPVVQSSATVSCTVLNVQAAPVSTGTANAIQYLNATKVPTTGTALQFDGTNIGINGTPNTWTAFKGIQVGNGVADSFFGASPNQGEFTVNCYYNAGWKYQYSAVAASRYEQSSGAHYWYTAPAGTAGNAISFTTAFTIDLNNNLIPGVAAKGINFTANTATAGSTSRLLNWYEEGTWTPTQGAGLTVVGAFSSSGRYTRVGRQVTISATLSGATSIACTAGGVFVGGLPFAPATTHAGVATSSNLGGTVLFIGTVTTYSVSAMAASGALHMTATYSV